MLPAPDAPPVQTIKPECFEVLQLGFHAHARSLLARALRAAEHRRDAARRALAPPWPVLQPRARSAAPGAWLRAAAAPASPRVLLPLRGTRHLGLAPSRSAPCSQATPGGVSDV